MTAKKFTDAFYKSLAEGDDVPKAFEVAKQALLVSRKDWTLLREADNYVLLRAHNQSPSDELAEPTPDLPRNSSGLSGDSQDCGTPCHVLSLPEHPLLPGSGEEQLLGVTCTPSWREPPNAGIEDYVGGQQDLVNLLSLFVAGKRCVCVTGKPGIGKTSLVKQLINFSQMYGRSFESAAVYVSCSVSPRKLPLCNEERVVGRSCTEPSPPSMRASTAPSPESIGDGGRSGLLRLIAKAVSDVARQATQQPRSPQSQSRVQAWTHSGGTDNVSASAVLHEAMGELEKRAESKGRFVLVALDDVDVLEHEDRRLLERLLKGYQKLRLLFAMREEWVGGDLAGHKVASLTVRGLHPQDAARLFLMRVHRRLKSKDFPDFPEDLRAAFDKNTSYPGEVDKLREEAERQLQLHPVLVQCDGNPAAIRGKASCVTDGLSSLMDLHET